MNCSWVKLVDILIGGQLDYVIIGSRLGFSGMCWRVLIIGLWRGIFFWGKVCIWCIIVFGMDVLFGVLFGNDEGFCIVFCFDRFQCLISLSMGVEYVYFDFVYVIFYFGIDLFD